MSSKRKRAIQTKTINYENSQVCVFCKKEDDNEFMFGKFYHLKNVSVHHNCMFFSSGLAQQTQNLSNGILGFKIEDIKKEVQRGKLLRCCYCKLNGATVGCAVTSCRRTFHFPCGKNNQSLHQFFGSFNSYCEFHKPVQKYVKTPKDAFHCHICYSSLLKANVEDRMYATCCKNNWYHKTCVQQYATSAGRYFFKCPMCKNSTDFIEIMEMYGIHIPERDASWELEENAFQDLYYRPECGASICQCDQGRKYDDDDGNWELLFCKLCGSKARHRFCENLGRYIESWECSECKVLEDQLVKKNVLQSQVPSERPIQKICLDGHHLNEKSMADCGPSCSSFDFSSYASNFASISSLRRALQCEVRVTPLKIITDANGVSKPLLSQSDEYVKTSDVTPVTITNMNRASKSLLNISNKMEKSNNITPIKISKIERDIENGDKKLSLDPCTNKRPCLKMKAINTFNNEQLIEGSVSTSKERSVKVKKVKPVKANNSKSVNAQRVKSHSKKAHSTKKHLNCCSNNTCISRFFGFECPSSKHNRLKLFYE